MGDVSLWLAALALVISVAAYMRSRVAERALDSIIAAMMAPGTEMEDPDPNRTF